MDIICVPSGFIDLDRPKKGLLTLKEGGFDSILFDMASVCSPAELENPGKPKKSKEKEVNNRIKISEQLERLQESLAPLWNQCREQRVHIAITFVPCLFPNTKHGDLIELQSRLVKESIKTCGRTSCRQLIVKPVFANERRETEWETNRMYYLGLADVARENNVTLLLVNQCRDVGGHLVRGTFTDADETAAWIDRLNEEAGEERFGFCMDVGVCTLCGQNMRELVMTLGSRIKAVILRDCDGHHDTAMLPFTCAGYGGQTQTDWSGLIRGLREIGFDGSLIMHFDSTTAAYSHLFRSQLLSLAKMTAEYFKWQIGMKAVLKKYNRRVLFGAGNMCRNYMKCYGEEFSPLFTCDNDKSRWGERFEGLEIKSPEAIKELDTDCAVFICNIYYREITDQLRQMGIHNPIEYFSDEYMPSYYSDRLEYWKGET